MAYLESPSSLVFKPINLPLVAEHARRHDALTVIDSVKDKITRIKDSLPDGTSIIPVYDRSDLIHRAIENLRRTLIEHALDDALGLSLDFT